ncbi:MAG: sulfurtransferase [Thermoanaerobaculia bacterium]|nr:sulfurtransferase [Thermoanaerobaculia bacterium]
MRKTVFVLALGLLAAPLFAAEAAPPAVRSELLVTPTWLAKRLDVPRMTILHVGKNDEVYREGHIPNALLVAWSEIAVSRDGIPNELPPADALTALVRRLGLDSQSRIVIYDEEDGQSAARAYFTLDYLGLGEQTALLDGQLAGWKAAGLPLSIGVREVAASSHELVPHPERITTKSDVEKIVTGKGRQPMLIDVRAIKYFTGEEVPKGLERGGHLPGARNVPVQDLIVSIENPMLKPAEELQKLFEAAGLEPGEPVVTYCNSGRQASLTYFALKYLGYEPSLYDGSMSEWAMDPKAPVEK